MANRHGHAVHFCAARRETHTYRVCDRRDPVGRRAAPSTPRAHGVDESVYWSLVGAYFLAISKKIRRLIRGRILRGFSPRVWILHPLLSTCHGSGSAGRSGFTAGSAAAASHCSKPQALRHAGRSMDKMLRPNPLIADARSHSYRHLVRPRVAVCLSDGSGGGGGAAGPRGLSWRSLQERYQPSDALCKIPPTASQSWAPASTLRQQRSRQ